MALFLPSECAPGIAISDNYTVATKIGATSTETNVILTRPGCRHGSCADCALSVTWYINRGSELFFGWARPDMSPITDKAYINHGSFVAANGQLFGLGINGNQTLPQVPPGSTITLRYEPKWRKIYARVNGEDEVLCFTAVADNLVPVVCLGVQGDSCSIRVRGDYL